MSVPSPANQGMMRLGYFFAAAGAGTGVDGVVADVVTAVLLTAFLFFFTCFFATGAELSAGAAVACAASDNPAVASARESPSIAEVIFFMGVLSDSFFGGVLYF